MSVDRRDYGRGTYLAQSFPWGTYHGGAALCADGRVRALKRISETADTFYSVPAAVRVGGRTVSGYVSVEDTAAGEPVVVFHAYTYGRNGHLLAGVVAP